MMVSLCTYRLSVCFNSLGDEGVCALAGALKTNTTLTRVAIWGNNLGEPSCNVSECNSMYIHTDYNFILYALGSTIKLI